MDERLRRWSENGVVLAINGLFLMVWGFAGVGKIRDGMPGWFAEKFGPTLLGTFPGVKAAFWGLAGAELLGAVLASVSLLRVEFLRAAPAVWLEVGVVWSLFLFLALGFGLWLTNDFNGGFQQFVYFCGTLVALLAVRNLRREPVVR